MPIILAWVPTNADFNEHKHKHSNLLIEVFILAKQHRGRDFNVELHDAIEMTFKAHL